MISRAIFLEANRTRIVIAITGLMVVVEITTGLLSHSMALLADGLAHEHARNAVSNYRNRLSLHTAARIGRTFQFSKA